MLYLGMMLPHILLDVAGSDQEESLRTGSFRFSSEFLRQTRETGSFIALKLQPVWTRHFRLNFHGEIACTIGRNRDVKRINARTGLSLISIYILKVHAVILGA